MRIAALDIGSNSFHLIVANVNATGRIDILDRAKELVRLGEALRSGVITPPIFDRGLEALRSLKRIADRHRPDALQAVATSAVREAQNGGEFVRAVRDELGIDVRVIRGQEEAHLIYLGARRALDLAGRRVALFDVGGGSTELILADARECYFTVSLKLGVLRLRDEWQCADPPTAREAAALADRVRSALEPTVARVKAMGFDFVALTSGTAFTLAGLSARLGGGQLNGPSKVLTFRALCDVEKKLLALPVADRAKLAGIDPKRADTIIPGAILLRAIFELAGVDEAALCEPALREGIIADYVAKNRPGIQLVEEFPDQRRRVVMELARRSHYPEAHSHHVARLALSIFHQTRELHGLSNSDGLLLEYAALLHDIGFYIAGNRHHRHAHYLITTHEMRGFSQEEVETVALIARYHRKTAPKKAHPEFARLPRETQKKVAKLSAILRLADSLDRTHANLVRAVRCTLNPKTIELRLETDDDPELELWAARRKGDLFEDLFGRRLRFAVDPPGELMNPKGLAKDGEQVVHPTLAPKAAPRLVKSR
ncbi:MAG TPA: Ppx/GppA phosphatase family protein [Polyangiaceae bacterium]|jgi:exopolyphosphatase/guanosine-5'-triphosphate,3'-diphosphate pyrophosphatase|nr:Ppx/GppA phosphatase family protein [Polyangiaceae bacterium]